MRIFLIPLSRTTRVLHCHSTLQPSSASYLSRTTNWASKKWEELGKAPPDNMKFKLYGAGSRMLEKIEHREMFLKEVPSKEDVTITTAVPFLYPSSLKEAQVHAEFKSLIEQRIPYHRKYMIYSALWVPVTSLFTIVPLVPNIPFFYNAFRLWSHYKAYNGAKHLDFLVKNGTVSFQPSDVLNLGLKHDPEFAVFFTSSNQLSKRRHKKITQDDPNSPVIAESTGELSPKLGSTHGASSTSSATLSTSSSETTTATTTIPKDDPMSMLDHVAQEGFLSDEEIHAIGQAFDHSSMEREIKRARTQEADKFIKEKMKKGSDQKLKQA